MPTEPLLHDSHVHLLLLAQRLNLIDYDVHEVNTIDVNELDSILQNTDKSLVQERINKLLNKHEFAIQSTISTNNFHLAYSTFKELEKVYFLLGTHPDIVKEDFNLESYLKTQRNYLETNFDITENQDNTLKERRIIGVGEIGLDYFYTKDEQIIKMQKSLFFSQLQISKELKIPPVFHVRDAFDDFFEILDKAEINTSFIVHCFTSNMLNAQKIVQRNGYLGIGGIITFKNSEQIVEAIKSTPLENIIIETDLPYLSPNPKRGKICLPEYIIYVAEFIANIKQISTQEVLSQSRGNVLKLFKI